MVRGDRKIGRLEWAVAARPVSGEPVSGDRHLVARFKGGAFIAVVDALGHGREAAVVAQEAIKALRSSRAETPGEALKECHERLRRTRGVAAAVASIHLDTGRMEWLSIGNVEGWVVRAKAGAPREAIIQLPGVVGYNMPRIPAVSGVELRAGDRLVIATDGIRDGFSDAINGIEPISAQADAVLEEFGVARDDALVFIAALGNPAK